MSTWMRRAAALLLLPLTGCGGRDAGSSITEPPVTQIIVGRFPTLSVTTDGAAPITSKITYVTGTWELRDPDSVLLKQGTLEIRGRGNSTWTMPKKPYRLKLAAATELLGMPANRHWALLANYADKTLLRNDLVLDLAQRMGWSYVPRSRFVHLRLNGSYDGVYQLAEHIRIDPNRVNIPELKAADTAAALITGGYLLEVDELYSEDFCWQTPKVGMPVCAKSPETLRQPGWEPQQAYITGYFRAFEDTLFGANFANPSTGYAAFIDVASAVDYILVNELVKNVDGNLRRSTYLTKPRGGKLSFGPLWDYDITLGNVNYGGADLPEGWQVLTAPWFARLMQDPAFVARLKRRWAELRSTGVIENWRKNVDVRWDYMSEAQKKNFERWPILNTWVWPNRLVPGSYNGEMAVMHIWLSARINWMDEQLKL